MIEYTIEVTGSTADRPCQHDDCTTEVQYEVMYKQDGVRVIKHYCGKHAPKND